MFNLVARTGLVFFGTLFVGLLGLAVVMTVPLAWASLAAILCSGAFFLFLAVTFYPYLRRAIR